MWLCLRARVCVCVCACVPPAEVLKQTSHREVRVEKEQASSALQGARTGRRGCKN